MSFSNNLFAFELPIILLIIVLVFRYHDHLEKFVAWLYSLCSRFSKWAARRKIKHYIQARINLFCKTKLASNLGLGNFKVVLNWLQKEQDRYDFKDDQVVLMVKRTGNIDEDICKVTIAFITATLFRNTKHLLSDSLARAIEMDVAREILRFNNEKAAISKFNANIIEPELKNDENLYHLLSDALEVRKAGYLENIFIPGIEDLSESTGEVFNYDDAQNDVEQLFDKLAEIATKEWGVDIELNLNGYFISLSFIIVGEIGKIQEIGIKPYINAIKMKQRHGVNDIYLLARKDKNSYLKMIVHYVKENFSLLNVIMMTEYSITIKPGIRIKAAIAHIRNVKYESV